MKKQKDSKVNIGNVVGNVVISQNQNGGITTHHTSKNIEERKKSFFKNKYVLAIGLIAAILGILGYFGLQPSNNNDIIPKQVIKQKNISHPTTIDIIKKEISEPQNNTIIKRNIAMKKKIKDDIEEKPISIGDVTGDVVISQNQTGGITAHSININEVQSPEWSMGKSEEIGENEWRTIFSARGKGHMAYYNWNILFTLNTEVIKREDVPGKVSVGPWMPLNVQGGNLSKDHFFIGFSEFKPGQYFSVYLYSKEPIKILRTEVLSE
jgi:hypothetical protein